MYGLQSVALSLRFLWLSQEVVSQINLQYIFGCQFKIIKREVDDTPTSKSFVYLYSECDWLLFLRGLSRIVLYYDLNTRLSGQTLAFLKLDCVLDCCFVEMYLFLCAQLRKSIFEIYINHELIPLSPTEWQDGEGLDLFANFIVHEHEQLVKDSCFNH